LKQSISRFQNHFLTQQNGVKRHTSMYDASLLLLLHISKNPIILRTDRKLTLIE